MYESDKTRFEQRCCKTAIKLNISQKHSKQFHSTYVGKRKNDFLIFKYSGFLCT